METLLTFLAGAISGGVGAVFGYQQVLKWLQKHSVGEK
jgi:hypothetical protein